MSWPSWLRRRSGGGSGAPEPILQEELDGAREQCRSLRQEVEGLAEEVERLRMENQILSEAMIVDPWTGLPNEAAFDADQLQLHARRRRSEERYAVFVADLDHFHDYNERFGLTTGDQALRVVAQTIKNTVRQSDRAYRFGGVQFAVLLPGADLRNAVAAAERTRVRVEKLGIEHPGDPAGVLTVTIGAIEAGYRHPTPKDVVAELNDVLLEGKLAGRNRVVWPR